MEWDECAADSIASVTDEITAPTIRSAAPNWALTKSRCTAYSPSTVDRQTKSTAAIHSARTAATVRAPTFTTDKIPFAILRSSFSVNPSCNSFFKFNSNSSWFYSSLLPKSFWANKGFSAFTGYSPSTREIGFIPILFPRPVIPYP